jgi:hypothetical protein
MVRFDIDLKSYLIFKGFLVMERTQDLLFLNYFLIATAEPLRLPLMCTIKKRGNYVRLN